MIFFLSFIEENLDRIGRADFTPEQRDILRVRQPTTAIIEHKYKIKDTNFLFVDVGGQRSERRKWISCFECVSSIMFVASLSDYDFYLTPDELRVSQQKTDQVNQRVNRLIEALNLFKATINLKKPVYCKNQDYDGRKDLLFKNVGIILFLNKKDLFDEKIIHSPLKSCFNDFDDTMHRKKEIPEIAKKFIARKFTDIVEQDRDFYCHFTYALDRESMEVVIQVVSEKIREIMLKNLML